MTVVETRWIPPEHADAWTARGWRIAKDAAGWPIRQPAAQGWVIAIEREAQDGYESEAERMGAWE